MTQRTFCDRCDVLMEGSHKGVWINTEFVVDGHPKPKDRNLHVFVCEACGTEIVSKIKEGAVNF